MTSTVAFAVDMPNDTGALALLKVLDSTIETVLFKKNEATSHTEHINKLLSEANRALFIGTYYGDIVPFAKAHEHCDITVYTFGDILQSDLPNLIYRSNKTLLEEFLGVATVALQFYKEGVQPIDSETDALVTENEKAIKIIDSRNAVSDKDFEQDEETLESHHFFAGMGAIEPQSGTLFDRFLSLYKGSVTTERVVEIGGHIFSQNVQLAQYIANSMSNIFSTKEGCKVAYANYPIMVNLGHHSLKKRYGDQVDFTMTFYVDTKSGQVVYSFRQLNLDAPITSKDLTSLFNGGHGGENDQTRGGRHKMDISNITSLFQ